MRTVATERNTVHEERATATLASIVDRSVVKACVLFWCSTIVNFFIFFYFPYFAFETLNYHVNFAFLFKPSKRSTPLLEQVKIILLHLFRRVHVRRWDHVRYNGPDDSSRCWINYSRLYVLFLFFFVIFNLEKITLRAWRILGVCLV